MSIGIFAVSQSFLTSSAQATLVIQDNSKHYPRMDLPADILSQRKYNVIFELTSPADVGKGLGATVGIARQWSIVATDFRFHFGAAQFGSFFGPATFKDTSVNTGNNELSDPNSEFNRPRSADDSWTMMTFEPGISVTGRMLPDKLPMWSQSARIGVGYARFQDQANSLPFTGMIVSTEADAIYNFSYKSRYGVIAGLAYNWGWIHSASSPAGDLTNSARRIPIYWLQFNAGLHYAF